MNKIIGFLIVISIALVGCQQAPSQSNAKATSSVATAATAPTTQEQAKPKPVVPEIAGKAKFPPAPIQGTVETKEGAATVTPSQVTAGTHTPVK